MRRIHILIMLLAVAAASCGGSTADSSTTSPPTSLVVVTTTTTPIPTLTVPPPSATESIEVWVPEGLSEWVAPAADSFEIETGIAVVLTELDADSVFEQLMTDAAAGPDVFIGPHAWLTSLAEAGVAEPVPAVGDAVAGAIDAVTLRGITYGLPVALDTIVQFRNTSTLPAAPTSIESLVAGCPVEGADEPVPCLLVATDSVDGHYPFLAGFGGYVFARDEYEGWDSKDIGVDGAEALAGIQVLDDLLASTGMFGDGSSTAEERFLEGVAPLVWGDSASLGVISRGDVDFTVEVLPTIGDQPAPTPVRATVAWVNATSPSKEAALVFVTEYLGSIRDAVAINLGLAPVSAGFGGDPALVPFVASARTGHAVPTIFQTEFAWETLADTFDDIRTGEDPTEALHSAAAIIRRAPGPPEPEVDDEG